MSVVVESSEIARASLHISLPWWTHLYTIPFLSLYPLLAYAYYVKYDEWLVSEEWTFLACVALGAGHALSFLVTKWNDSARAWITTNKVRLCLPFLIDQAHSQFFRCIRLKRQIVFGLCPMRTVDGATLFL